MDNYEEELREFAIECPECGSMFFTEQTYNMYRREMYGSAPGADISAMTSTQPTLRVCLCGYPYSPNVAGARGRSATWEKEEFAKSLQRAQQYRKQMHKGGEITMKKVAKGFVALCEFEDLKAKVEELSRVLADKVAKTAE